MNIQDYVEPLSEFYEKEPPADDSIGEIIEEYLPGLDLMQGGYKVALLGIPDISVHDLYFQEQIAIRKHLYRLTNHIFPANQIIDLGSIVRCKSNSDVYYALKDVVTHLLDAGIIPILIGSKSLYTKHIYDAYAPLGNIVNIVSLNSRLNITSPTKQKEKDFINNILLDNSNYLFNYTNIAYQSYYTTPGELDILKEMFFDKVRLGHVRDNIIEVEPVLRDADIFCADINSVKHADAPGQINPSPNGINSDEYCRILRYAGLSDKLTSVLITGYMKIDDNNEQTAGLLAQGIWHFIDGVYNRKGDYPVKPVSEYKKIVVHLDEENRDMIFYHNKLTNRWWLEVSTFFKDEKKTILVACLYKDYQQSCSQEVPDRWWKVYQKIS